MSPQDNFVSNRATGLYDPRTGSGVATGGAVIPIVHECGLMTLDGAWNYQNVCSPFWRAYLNFDPGAAVMVAGKRLPLRPGRVILLPEETVYSCIPKPGTRHLWIHFSLPTSAAPPPPACLRLSAGQLAPWETLARRIAGGAASAELHALSTGLLLLALADRAAALPTSPSPRWSAFLTWVESRLSRPPSLREMATHLGMSPRTFLRWFRGEADTTPADWLLRRRIREACRLLRFGDDSIDQVAAATGFRNRHHFSRVFAVLTGTTPAAYRRPKTAELRRDGPPRR